MVLLQTFWPHDRLVRCEALQVDRLAVQTRRQAPHKSYCSSLCWLLTAFHCTCIFTISGRELHRMQQDSRIRCPSQMWNLAATWRPLGHQAKQLKTSPTSLTIRCLILEPQWKLERRQMVHFKVIYQFHLHKFLIEKQNQTIPSKVAHDCMRYQRL